MDNETRQHLEAAIKRWSGLTVAMSLQTKIEVYTLILRRRESATSAMLDLSMAIMADPDFQVWQNEMIGQMPKA